MQLAIVNSSTGDTHLQDCRNKYPVLFLFEFSALCFINICRSQWPHCLSHEISSSARTLGS
jgi:hypothetical protein